MQLICTKNKDLVNKKIRQSDFKKNVKFLIKIRLPYCSVTDYCLLNTIDQITNPKKAANIQAIAVQKVMLNIPAMIFATI